jgi:putative colanic acid biosynthesis acetyltransferase WcaF
MHLVVKPISIGDGAWIGAFAKIAPGVRVGREAIVTLGAVLFGDAEACGIYRGNPAVKTGVRLIGSDASRDQVTRN